MTAPTPTIPSTSPAAPPPASRAPRGYLAATVGALLGVSVLGGLGVAVGVGLMDLYYDPGAGLANLGLLLFPLTLGGVGTLAGAFVGIRTALRRGGFALATQTAWVAVGLIVFVLALTVVTSGIGMPLVPVAPPAARWLVLQGAATG